MEGYHILCDEQEMLSQENLALDSGYFYTVDIKNKFFLDNNSIVYFSLRRVSNGISVPQANREAEEAEEMKKELGLGDTTDSLRALILKRGKEREQEADEFLDSLAAKYGGGGSGGRKKGSKKKQGKK